MSSYTYAPLAPKQSSFDSTSTTTSSALDPGVAGLQGSWGNQALLAMLNATRAVVPDARGLCDAIETDGIDALAHPFEAIERQESRDALAGRLVVLEPGQQPTAPNEVSPEEYKHMVELLSNVRNDDCNLGFDLAAETLMDEEDVEAFRAGALTDITAIMQTASGRYVLDELAYGTEYHTELRPGASPFTGITRPVSATNGAGSSTRVYYTPDETVRLNEAAGGPARSDVVLFHELVHAWHATSGDLEPEQLIDSKLPPEHQVIGLRQWAADPFTENAYREERLALVGAPGEVDGDAGVRERERYTNLGDPFYSTESNRLRTYASAP